MMAGSLSNSSSSQSSQNSGSVTEIHSNRTSADGHQKTSKTFKGALGAISKGFKLPNIAKSLGFQKTSKPTPFVPKHDEIWFKPSSTSANQTARSPDRATAQTQSNPSNTSRNTQKPLSQMSTQELNQRKGQLENKLARAKLNYKNAVSTASSPKFESTQVRSTIMNAKNQLSRVKAQVFAETKKIDLEIASRHDDGAVIILDYDPSQTIGENLAKNTLNRPSSGGDRARTQTHREPEGLVYGRAHAPSSPTFRNRTLGAEAIAPRPSAPQSAPIALSTPNTLNRGVSVLGIQPLNIKTAPPKPEHVGHIQGLLAQHRVDKSVFKDPDSVNVVVKNLIATDSRWAKILTKEFAQPFDGPGTLSPVALDYTLAVLKRALD